jgi:hypothetical protein
VIRALLCAGARVRRCVPLGAFACAGYVRLIEVPPGLRAHELPGGGRGGQGPTSHPHTSRTPLDSARLPPRTPRPISSPPHPIPEPAHPSPAPRADAQVLAAVRVIVREFARRNSEPDGLTTAFIKEVRQASGTARPDGGGSWQGLDRSRNRNGRRRPPRTIGDESSSRFNGRRSGSGLTRVLCSCSRSGRWTCRSRTWRRWCRKCNDALMQRCNGAATQRRSSATMRRCVPKATTPACPRGPCSR